MARKNYLLSLFTFVFDFNIEKIRAKSENFEQKNRILIDENDLIEKVQSR